MTVQRYTFGYVEVEQYGETDIELQMIPAKYGEAVKHADYERLERIAEGLRDALKYLADKAATVTHAHIGEHISGLLALEAAIVKADAALAAAREVLKEKP